MRRKIQSARNVRALVAASARQLADSKAAPGLAKALELEHENVCTASTWLNVVYSTCARRLRIAMPPVFCTTGNSQTHSLEARVSPADVESQGACVWVVVESSYQSLHICTPAYSCHAAHSKTPAHSVL